jgi:hypothetical protein
VSSNREVQSLLSELKLIPLFFDALVLRVGMNAIY